MLLINSLIYSTLQIGAKSMNFIRRLNKGNFYLSTHSLKFGYLLGGCKLTRNTKVQLNISKNYARKAHNITGK